MSTAISAFVLFSVSVLLSVWIQSLNRSGADEETVGLDDSARIDLLVEDAEEEIQVDREQAVSSDFLASQVLKAGSVEGFLKLTSKLGGEERLLMLNRLALDDAELALRVARGTMGEGATRSVLETIGGSMGESGFSLYKKVSFETEKSTQGSEMSSMLRGWARVDFESANEYLIRGFSSADDYPGIAKGAAVRALSFAKYESEGVDGLVNWASSIDDVTVRRNYMSAAGMLMYREDRGLATAWLADHPSLDIAGPAVRYVAKDWSSYDKRAAVDWAASLKNDRVSRAVTFSLLQDWIDDDHEEASMWLADLPDNHASRVNLVGRFARSVSRKDPELGFLWARTLRAEQNRAPVLRAVAEAAFSKNPELFREIVQWEGLTEHELDSLSKIGEGNQVSE